MNPVVAADQPARAPQAWYREVTPPQWRAFLAAYLGWVLDAFDFTILTFLLVDIQRSFTVSKALAGALGSITLICRMVGGMVAGTAADRWGRKPPLLFSILWYSVFAFLSGFSTLDAMLFALRALFGFGMGGVWAAGMPLALENWPANLRGTASGMMQSGYSMGFLLSSVVFQFAYPGREPRERRLARHAVDRRGARVSGALHDQSRSAEPRLAGTPAPPPRTQRAGSPLNRAAVLARRAPWHRAHVDHDERLPLDISIITYQNPTLIAQQHKPTLPYLAALNVGAIAGAVFFGLIPKGRLGRRGSAAIATLVAIVVIPVLDAMTTIGPVLWCGALAMGFFGAGNFGVVPGYLTERFPTIVRGAGAGFG